MKAGIICFTEHGVLLAEQLVNGLAAHGILCEAWLKKKEYRSALPVEVAFLEGTLSEWTAEQFRSKDLLIFIGSTGIAVRSIAPYVQSKKTDPAVIVVDEQGRHNWQMAWSIFWWCRAITGLIFWSSTDMVWTSMML